MRTFLGIVLLVLGIPVLLIGGAAAVIVGTDDTVDILTETVESDSTAVVIPSTVLEIAGPTLEVSAEVDGADTFLGAAHPVHVDSYLGGVPQTRASEITLSREVTLNDVEAAEEPVTPPPPDGMDWWAHRSVGAGEQAIEVPLTEDPVSIVVLAAEPTSPLAVTVSGAVQADNLFTTALLIAAVGLILVIAGILVLRAARRRRRRRQAAADDDESGNASSDTAYDDGTGGGDTGGDTGHDDAGSSHDTEVPTQPGPGPSRDPSREPGIAPVTPLRPPPPSPTPPPDSMPDDPDGPDNDQPGNGRGRSLRTMGIVVPVTALLAGGCASIPERVEDRSTALVASTPEQSAEFFSRYTETNNEANAAQDPELLAPIETGPLLESSTFGYEVQRAQGQEPTEPFTVAPTALAAPTFDSYPLFYYASAANDGGGAQYLVTRPSATQPWRAAASVHLNEEQSFDLNSAVGNGTPDVADDEAIEAGRSALNMVVEYAEAGEAPEGLTVDPGRGLDNLSTFGFGFEDGVDGVESTERSCEVAPAVEGAWVTTDSGVLTIATITCTQSTEMADGFWFVPGEDYGTITADSEVTSSSITASVPFVAEIADDGTTVVHPDAISLTETTVTTR